MVDWIQVLVIAATAAIMYWQLRAIRDATALQGFLSIAQALNGPESRRARGLLFRSRRTGESLKEDDWESIERVLVLFDELGCLVNLEFVPERLAIEMYWDVAIKCWDASEEWIMARRSERGSPQSIDRKRVTQGFKFIPGRQPRAENYPDTFLENFEILVWRCERYCRDRGIVRPTIY